MKVRSWGARIRSGHGSFSRGAGGCICSGGRASRGLLHGGRDGRLSVGAVERQERGGLMVEKARHFEAVGIEVGRSQVGFSQRFGLVQQPAVDASARVSGKRDHELTFNFGR